MVTPANGPVPPGPDDRTDSHHHQPPPRTVAALQVLSLLCFVGYAVLGMLRNVPLDRYVLLGILAFGVGLRPESLGQIIRGVVEKR